MPALADVNQAALPRSAELHPLDAAKSPRCCFGARCGWPAYCWRHRTAGALARRSSRSPCSVRASRWQRSPQPEDSAGGAVGRGFFSPRSLRPQSTCLTAAQPAASAAFPLLDSEAAERIAKVSVALSMLLIGLGLWLPATSIWGMAGFWLLVAGEEAWAASERRPGGAVPTPPRCEPAAPAEMSCESDVDAPVLCSPAESDVAVTQANQSRRPRRPIGNSPVRIFCRSARRRRRRPASATGRTSNRRRLTSTCAPLRSTKTKSRRRRSRKRL